MGSLCRYAYAAPALSVRVAVGDVRQYACAVSAVVVVVAGSRHLPNQPGVVHVVVVASLVVVSLSLVVLSLQPNQPGWDDQQLLCKDVRSDKLTVLQVLVEVDVVVVIDDVVVLVVLVVVVLSSRHPHQPGVLQVSVRVTDVDVVVGSGVVVVVCCFVPFSNFQR